jgi:hypothetical protein
MRDVALMITCTSFDEGVPCFIFDEARAQRQVAGLTRAPGDPTLGIRTRPHRSRNKNAENRREWVGPGTVIW